MATTAKSPKKKKGNGTTPRRRSPRLAAKSVAPDPATSDEPASSAADAEPAIDGVPAAAATMLMPDELNHVEDGCTSGALASSLDQEREIHLPAGGGNEAQRIRAPPRTGHGRRLLAVLLVVAVCGCLVGLVSGADALPKWPVREQAAQDNTPAPLRLRARGALSEAAAHAAAGARLLVQGAQGAGASLARLSAVLRVPAPALCLAGAAALPALFQQLHAPAWLSWAGGVSLVGLAALLAAMHDSPLGGTGTTASVRPAPVGPLTPSVLHALLGDGPSSAVIGAWADSWRASAADPGSFTAAKLVLHTTVSAAPGPPAVEEEFLQACRGLVPPSSVLELTADGCVRDVSGTRPSKDGGPPPVSDCARRLAEHLSHASAAELAALVIVRGVEKCTDDVCFDALLSPLERFVDSTLRQPIIGGAGPVRASVAAFVLVASHLSVERCEELRQLPPVALKAKLAAGFKTLWPASSFSYDVNVAKRALLNRLGTISGAVVCASPE